MRSCNGTFFTSDIPLVFYMLLVFKLRSLTIWPGSGLSGSCSPSKLLDATLLPVKAGTGTDAIVTSGVPGPLDGQQRNIAEKLSPHPHPDDRNRLSHVQNLKMINLKDQESPDSGNVPFKKLKICRLC